MCFQIGDGVRYKKAGQRFGVITSAPPGKDFYKVKAVEAKGVVNREWEKDQVEPDTALPASSLWLNNEFQRPCIVVSLAAGLAAPACYQQQKSQHQYVVRETDGSGQTYTVNGSRLEQGNSIASTSDKNDLFACLNRKVPLVYLPPDLRNEATVLAYRGVYDTPYGTGSDDDKDWEKVFVFGFQSRQKHSGPIFQTVVEGKPKFDIYIPSSVCASHNPESACIFPLATENQKKQMVKVTYMWLYAFFTGPHFETLQIQRQLLESASDAHSPIRDYRENLALVLLGREIAIDKQGVPPEQIVCAARFKREWKDPMEWWQGCTLTMDGEVVFNENNFLKDRLSYDIVKTLIAGRLKACHQTPKPV